MAERYGYILTNFCYYNNLNALNLKFADGDLFVLENNDEINIIIFSPWQNLKALSESKMLLMNGTFCYCTMFFQQFFTIHGV